MKNSHDFQRKIPIIFNLDGNRDRESVEFQADAVAVHIDGYYGDADLLVEADKL